MSMSGEPGRKTEATGGVQDAKGGETKDAAVSPGADQRPSRAVTARAIALGIPLVAINAYWVTVVEVRWYTLDGTSLPLFITPIFFLFCVCALNALWRRAAPSRALDTGELLTIYIMLVVGTVLAAHDLLQN